MFERSTSWYSIYKYKLDSSFLNQPQVVLPLHLTSHRIDSSNIKSNDEWDENHVTQKYSVYVYYLCWNYASASRLFILRRKKISSRRFEIEEWKREEGKKSMVRNYLFHLDCYYSIALSSLSLALKQSLICVNSSDNDFWKRRKDRSKTSSFIWACD